MSATDLRPTQMEFEGMGASEPGALGDEDTDLSILGEAGADFDRSRSDQDSGVRADAMREAMSDIANIVTRAAQSKEKLTRSAIKAKFGRAPGEHRPLAFVVIHALTTEQVAKNVQIALEEGADGVFLINHDFDYPQLLPIIRHVRGLFPDLFLGTNFHTMNGADAFPILGRLAREGVKIDAYWADNACIDHERPHTEQPMASKILETRASSGWDGLYFGGTAFKNPKNHVKLCRAVPVEASASVAATAAGYMDVVTTSGPASGEAPEPEKIMGMREGCKETPLALASGVSEANVAQFAAQVDAFLLATSIQSDSHNIDGGKLRAFLTNLRAAVP
mmetsp:Transcript_48195/g.113760  ORF Transcript_48195/g.113760 Transcript_48195/m.113760 type:complete len:335 (-) Transcript_48195:62-1066(-)|eukprot:CAMPEP_0177711396 /NCGR_PEP_ID=MMETSP0484_2-20121128/11840_1 /TAXON_ID=354590 /ORGANISM="Rhodomonas lens, Strain RHODO" /LENGTH=334 /DNA_ID=CAMNT_0019223129 /DNA_START=284 /DNA_END=1288 /DNA_ORIENTATION=+